MEIAVDFASGSGPAFRQVVTDTIADLPPRVAAGLATGGVRVVAGKRLTDSCPDLMNQRPPGYPDDADYTNVRFPEFLAETRRLLRSA